LILYMHIEQAHQKTMSAMETVKNLKQALEKELPIDSADVERCSDLLDRLTECTVTLDMLAETMIGKTVSSFKKHAALGPKAKGLVKKWKEVAKQEEGAAATKQATPSPTTAPRKIAKPKTAKRRSSSTASGAKTTSAADDVVHQQLMTTAESEWAGLPGLRQNICKKFMEILLGLRSTLIKDGLNAEAVDQLLGPRAAEVEGALWQHVGGDQNRKAYADKARSLVFNLRKNKALTEQVILGQLPSQSLVKLSSDELASAETKQAREKEAKKLVDSKRLDWEEANEAKINDMCGIKGELLNASLFTCGRCKSTKTTSTQKQTRSADEPMTVFVFCMNCGKRWKC